MHGQPCARNINEKHDQKSKNDRQKQENANSAYQNFIFTNTNSDLASLRGVFLLVNVSLASFVGVFVWEWGELGG